MGEKFECMNCLNELPVFEQHVGDMFTQEILCEDCFYEMEENEREYDQTE